MKAGRLINGWTLIAVVLTVIVIAGGVYIGLKHGQDQPIEITLAPNPPLEGTVYIGGEVNNPGYYPLYAGDTFDDLVRAAGGPTEGADLGHIEVKVPGQGRVAELQQVNINTAGAWLLAALPGIGEVRAQEIVSYRQRNGLFRDTREIMNIEGIGEATFELIKDLITVGD